MYIIKFLALIRTCISNNYHGGRNSVNDFLQSAIWIIVIGLNNICYMVKILFIKLCTYVEVNFLPVDEQMKFFKAVSCLLLVQHNMFY